MKFLSEQNDYLILFYNTSLKLKNVIHFEAGNLSNQPAGYCNHCRTQGAKENVFISVSKLMFNCSVCFGLWPVNCSSISQIKIGYFKDQMLAFYVGFF